MEKTALPFIDTTALSKKLCEVPIRTTLKYATNENFIGHPLPGYHENATDICLLTPKVAYSLCQAQNHFIEDGFCLLVFDAYRPLRTVKYFGEWMQQKETSRREHERKAIHYPHLKKEALSALGYVASTVSRHCFGYAVDLTLIRLDSGSKMNMGAEFDFFDPIAGHGADETDIGKEAHNHRLYLARTLHNHGFHLYEKEFWHFDHHIHELAEPADIEITASLRGIINE